MSEKELVREMDRIARESLYLEEAIDRIEALFATEVGATRFLARPVHGSSVFSEPAVGEFLESRRFPFRGVYVAPFGPGALIACIGSWGAPHEAIPRLVDYAAGRLSSQFYSLERVGRHAEAA